MNTLTIQKNSPYDIGGFTCIYRLTGEDSHGTNALMEVNLEPATLLAPPHVHDNEDEWFYILEGTCRAQVGGDVVDLRAGDTAFVPRGTAHTLVNTGDTPARFLMGVTPAGMEPFFAEIAAALPDAPALPAAAFADFGAFMEQAVQAEPAVSKAMATVNRIWGKYGMRAAPM